VAVTISAENNRQAPKLPMAVRKIKKLQKFLKKYFYRKFIFLQVLNII